MTRCRVRIGLYPFQSTLPARGATTLSICTPPVVEYFNPRSPHGERPPYRGGWKKSFSFQSTLPARGATSTVSDTAHASTHFNPRSPHGERRDLLTTPKQPKEFQSTLPTRGATAEEFGGMGWVLFQSTLPTRGATFSHLLQNLWNSISIHAPHTGSDAVRLSCPRRTGYFNPRSPHGERPKPPNWRACMQYFNPRSPHGERRSPVEGKPLIFTFQSTLPTRGATFGADARNQGNGISIHAPHTGSDNKRFGNIRTFVEISIHAPHTGSDSAK